ncbi:MAG: threonylcarbamoyl-AMP synthase [Sphingobacteriaceae bacterium]|nr:threonylcarbamoyl-AMP synthase [Sphingobacteriaceae bacterium]
MLIRLNDNSLSSKGMDQIISCLKNGGLIIYPTDTVYALGADITNVKAFEKICKLKGIKPDKANFSFVCSNLSHLSEYTSPIPNPVYRIMRKALPGPYTFILNASQKVPKLLKQNKKTVGIRVPNNKICTAIVEQLGNPLISTSLHNENDDILEYFSDPELIHQQYESEVDIVVDGGFGNVYPSTVIDCSGDECVIVREGAGDASIINL